MDFPLFVIIVLIGNCGLFWLEDEVKEAGDPIPEFMMVIGVLIVNFVAFAISIL